jgi:YVTN family beta-propeller protein
VAPSGTLTGGNSSPTPEIGAVIDDIETGFGPAESMYDPLNGLVYVANQNGNSISILNGTESEAIQYGGTAPYGLAYDPHGGEVYVSNTGSPNITVLQGPDEVGTVVTAFPTSALIFDPVSDDLYAASTTGTSVEVIEKQLVAGAVQVGTSPKVFAYDASDGDIYLTNSQSGNVSVISGTQIVASILVGSFPESAAYDPSDGDVYVANLVSGTVSVLHGWAVAATIGVGSDPECVVADPRTGDVYVCNAASDNVSVISGTRVVGSVPTDSGPTGGVFDPLTGDLYFTNLNSQTMTVVNGTKAVGTIVLRTGPENPSCDVATGELYVPQFGDNNVSVISTALAEGPLALAPPGSPAQTADVGEAVSFHATLWAIGTGNDTASWSVAPAAGTSCGPQVSSARIAGQIFLALACEPKTPGTYTVWVNASDSGRWKAWAFEQLEVFGDPSAGPVGAQLGANPNARSADVGENFRVVVAVSGGTGNFVTFAWTGLPPGDCTQTLSSSPSCIVPTPTNLTIGVTVADSNGFASVGQSLAFRVFPLPVASEVLPSRASADVGQAVTFTTEGSGGSGGYNFSWSGIPPGGCIGIHSAQVTCRDANTGTLRVQAVVIDSNNGSSAPSPAATVGILSDPSAAGPVLSVARIVLGGTVTIGVGASGGSGDYMYTWQGLPPGCAGTGATIVACQPQASGTFTIDVVLNDSNGFAVTSGTVTLEVSPAPSSGLSDLQVELWGGGAAAAVIVGVLLYLGLSRRRRATAPPRPSPAEPEEEESAEAPVYPERSEAPPTPPKGA